jgi:hypothetical protein
MKVFKPLFYLALIGLLVTGSMTTKNSFLLKTAHAPLGIISLELNPGHLHQQKIFKEWASVYINQQVYSRDTVITGKITGLTTATTQTKKDNSFVAFYVLFVVLLFYKYRDALDAVKPGTRIRLWIKLALLVLLAGLLDLYENSQILKAIANYSDQKLIAPGISLRIFFPALFKFILLFTALIYFCIKIKALRHISLWLQRLSAFLRTLVSYSWKFRIVLIGLLVLFFLLALTNQGQDLLVTINTSDWGIILFFSITTVLALLNWYLPKIYDNLGQATIKNIAQRNLKYADNTSDKLDFARFLGLFTFLIPAVGILITMKAYHISYLAADISPLVILAVLSILYINALRYHWLDYIYKPKNKFKTGRYILTMLLIFGAIIYWGMSAQTHAPFYLAYLSLGFFLLSFAFVVTISYRTCITAFIHIPIAPFILVSGILVSLVFIAFNFDSVVFSLTKNDRFYTLPIVIAGMVAYTLIFSFLLILGYKTGIQFITLFLIIVIYRSVTSINNIHKVHLVPKPANQVKAADLRSYSRQWLESRKTEISSFNDKYKGVPYPVFFVNAYGGGIKAAAWTTMVIGRLDQLLQDNTPDDEPGHDFQHYAFSYSGVSGGTIGLSLLCAGRIQQQGKAMADSLFYPVNSLKIYHHDYLTATLVALFGRDALMALVGLNLYPDRARLQEKNWELFTGEQGLNFHTLLGEGWKDPKKEVPLFFSNTYDINTGFKGLLAPVLLNKKDFPGTILLQEQIPENQDILLSTAAFISSRFPYLSPTAKFDEKHHFMDGGTLENSGAETSLQVFKVFKSVLDSLQLYDASYKNIKVKFNFLSLPNSVPVMDSLQRVKNLYEPLAPALGILNSTNGNTLKADTINRYMAEQENWNYFSINPTVKKIKVANVWPVLPLGWQISDYALEQMVLSVTDQKSVVHLVLREFPMYTPP